MGPKIHKRYVKGRPTEQQTQYSKAPIELLYLETGTTPVEFILASRRFNYLHTIVTRNNSELTKQIYTKQKENPIKGDWYYHILESKDLIELQIDDKEIETKTSCQFKAIVKRHV